MVNVTPAAFESLKPGDDVYDIYSLSAETAP
jgi:hypothetical protein